MQTTVARDPKPKSKPRRLFKPIEDGSVQIQLSGGKRISMETKIFATPSESSKLRYGPMMAYQMILTREDADILVASLARALGYDVTWKSDGIYGSASADRVTRGIVIRQWAPWPVGKDRSYAAFAFTVSVVVATAVLETLAAWCGWTLEG